MLGLVWVPEECQEPVPCQACQEQARVNQVQVQVPECLELEARGPLAVDKASK